MEIVYLIDKLVLEYSIYLLLIYSQLASYYFHECTNHLDILLLKNRFFWWLHWIFKDICDTKSDDNDDSDDSNDDGVALKISIED